MKSHEKILVNAISKSTLGLFSPISTLLYVPVEISTPFTCNCATISLFLNPFSFLNLLIMTPLYPSFLLFSIFSHIYSKAEDLLFLLICKIPDKLIPPSIMSWCKNYLNKRSEGLQQEIIRQ